MWTSHFRCQHEDDVKSEENSIKQTESIKCESDMMEDFVEDEEKIEEETEVV